MSVGLNLVSGKAYSLAPGQYQYVVNHTAGTVTFEISLDDGTTFKTMVDGVFSADSDGTLWAGSGSQIRVTISATASVSLFKIQ